MKASVSGFTMSARFKRCLAGAERVRWSENELLSSRGGAVSQIMAVLNALQRQWTSLTCFAAVQSALEEATQALEAM